MTTKEFLQQYLNAEAAINAKLEEISRLRALATKTTQTLIPDKVQTGNHNRMESILVKIADIERETDKDIDKLHETKKTVQRAILSVKGDRLQTLLQYRYICGYTFEKIAVEMNYSWIHVVKNLHPKALKSIKEYMEVYIQPVV